VRSLRRCRSGHGRTPPGSLAGEELAVAFVDVALKERTGERVGASDEDRRNAEGIGGETCRGERPLEMARRNEHLAAHVSALLLARQLVLEMNACCAGLDHALHQLERVQRPPEPSLGVRDDRREPVRPSAALGPRDLVGALQRVVDAPDERGNAVRGIERLIRVRCPATFPSAATCHPET
jgi:hypothetical protein